MLVQPKSRALVDYWIKQMTDDGETADDELLGLSPRTRDGQFPSVCMVCVRVMVGSGLTGAVS